MEKSRDAFRTISEVAEWLDTPAHVLRFWESRFTQVKPVKRAGGRRYYRPGDMELLGGIKKLLHSDGMTIRGVQKLLRKEGVRHIASLSPDLDVEHAFSAEKAALPKSTEPDTAEIVEISPTENVEQTPTAVEVPEIIADAPMDVDVQQEPVENVFSMTGDSDDPGEADETVEAVAEPEASDDTQDLAARTPEEIEAAQARIAALASRHSDSSSRDGSRDGTHSPRAAQPNDLQVEHVPEEAAAKPVTPRPIISDVPEDPSDDDVGFKGITGVAAALRRAARSDHRQKPSPEVYGELYQRLRGLAERMDERPDADGTD